MNLPIPIILSFDDVIYDKDKPTIILLHENGAHFQLIGHFQDIMKTHFTHSDLPLEIKGLFDV